MWIGVISLFPKMLNAITDYGITRKAIKNGVLNIQCWSPRDFTKNKHRTVDDRPYGGGPGMLMMIQPLQSAIHEARKNVFENIKVIYLSPQGRKLDQQGLEELASNNKIILVCGRYEGIDERLIASEIDEEWSLGDYIVTGGELAAMVIIDGISRLIPGVLKNTASAREDSFAKGLLDYPQYTRPEVLNGMRVPPVLLSGNHNKIRRWRLKQSLGRTWLRRPDLLADVVLTNEEITLLTEFQYEYNSLQYNNKKN